MYLNSVYLGNKMQGLTAASQYYFNTAPEQLTDWQILQLLATLSNPSGSNPFKMISNDIADSFSKKFNVPIEKTEAISGEEINSRINKFNEFINTDSYFEPGSFGLSNTNSAELTIDKDLTDKLREILKRNIEAIKDKNTTNGAIVAIATKNNELISIVGSPDPNFDFNGYKINMAIKPRPIGSTIKPFIYLKGFEKKLRPYTLVDDKEYKYTINDGFAFYPKNYDYKYRGRVDLHNALSNSLNVPTVRVLDYIGINNFNNFLTRTLELIPQQDINTYQLGIALGGLEMDLLSLSYYFTIFPNHGYLRPLQFYKNSNNFNFTASTNFLQNKKISDEKYIELVNKILTDRVTGIEQFGIKSNLNLLSDNYAVKTGTSREYHDSWTIGYTPDFLVGVWVGNNEDKPMDNVSGVAGAGKIWQEAMNLLLNSE